MTKKMLSLLALIALAVCLFSYKFGSAPVALAQGRQDASELAAAPLTLPPAPATWALFSAGGARQAKVTKAAGGAGVKHVATCVSAAFHTISPGGSDLGADLFLLDGSTTVLAWYLQAPVEGQSDIINVCGLNVVGSANTAMTLEFGNAYSYDVESVNLIGYDAQ